MSAEEVNYCRQQQHQQPGNHGNTPTTSAVVWKRVREQRPSSADSYNYDGTASGGLRVINAVLDGDAAAAHDEIDKYDYEEQRRSSKRRKLTILDSEEDSIFVSSNEKSSKKKKGKPIMVLDPLTRMVDDSLQEVLVGTKTIREHYDLITTSSVLMSPSSSSSRRHSTTQSYATAGSANSNKKEKMTTVQTWLCWVHSSGGNILHCCALWNDDVMARTILSTTTAAVMMPSYQPSSSISSVSIHSPFVRQITESVDSDGRTPYEVAALCGHDNVCKVLTDFGGDTSNYIYDVFHHLPYTMSTSASTSTMTDGNTSMGPQKSNGETGPNVEADHAAETATATGQEEWMTMDMTTAFLTSGVGYWTPEGELVLEADSADRRRHHNHEDEEYYEDDVDSNCEDYDANDYPDYEEEEDDDGGNGGDDDDGHYGQTNGAARYCNTRLGGGGGGAAFYHGGDDGYEYDWEQDLGGMYFGGDREFNKEDYNYYVPDDDEDDED